MVEFTENETTVADLRSSGLTYREVAEKLGVTQERARQLHIQYYRKISTNRDIEKNWKSLDRECEKLGIAQKDVVRIIRILKRAGINSIDDPLLLDNSTLDRIYGIGVRYEEAIRKARPHPELAYDSRDGRLERRV